MNKALEKILEDELFKEEKVKGLGSVTINGTSKNTNMQIEVEGNSTQEKREGKNLFNVNDKKENSTYKSATVDNDDWINIKCTNETEEPVYPGYTVNPSEKFEINTQYYAVLEVKKFEASEDNTQFIFLHTSSSYQCNTSQIFRRQNLLEENVKIVPFTTKEDFTNCDRLIGPYLSVGAGQSAEITFRVSIFKEQPTKESFVYEKYGTMPSLEFPSEIKSCGDNINLFDFVGLLNILNISLPNSFETKGVNFTIQTDGGIHVKGTSTDKIQYWIKGGYNATQTLTTLQNLNNVIASGSHSDWGKGLQVSFSNYDGTTRNHLEFTEKKYNYKEYNLTGILFSINSGVAVNETIYLKIEKGTKATPYSKFGEGNINLTVSNGNSEEQNITIPVQKSFRAIENYKDTFINKNGKWYEQHKIKRIESYNSEEINTDFMSSTNGLDVGATVDYVLAEPEEIECTDEQTKILNKLQRIQSYEDVTHIICIDETQCNIKATSKISRIKKLEEQLAQRGEQV